MFDSRVVSVVVLLLSLGAVVYFLRMLSRVFKFENVMSTTYLLLVVLVTFLAVTTPTTALGTLPQGVDRYQQADAYQQKQIDRNESRITTVERNQSQIMSRVTALETLAVVAKENSNRLFGIFIVLGVMVSERLLYYITTGRKKPSGG